MHSPLSNPPLVLGCHHKTGSVLLIQLMERLVPRLRQKGRLSQPVSGSPIDRKAPLSGILDHYRTCDCYFNMWFEHEIDVPADRIRLIHFVRHPVKWIRSAYLYHKKGAPSDGIRWLDWQVFRVKGKHLSYCELLKHFDVHTGLAIEAVRSFPEIIGTARVARTSAHLAQRWQLSLEQVHDDFGSAIRRFCTFVGFSDKESERMAGELRHLDLTQSRQGPAPVNVTRNAPDSADLEHLLEHDSSFRRLFSQAGKDMGFSSTADESQASSTGVHPDTEPDCLARGLCAGDSLKMYVASTRCEPGTARAPGAVSGCTRSILPEPIVNALLDGVPQFSTHWQTAERAPEFMRGEDASQWWSPYVLQTFGCGHLMMHGFIQQLVDAVE